MKTEGMTLKEFERQVCGACALLKLDASIELTFNGGATCFCLKAGGMSGNAPSLEGAAGKLLAALYERVESKKKAVRSELEALEAFK